MTKKNEKTQAAEIKASSRASGCRNGFYIRNPVPLGSLCLCVCVLGAGPDFRERRVYKVKCDLCGAGVPRQVEKDPETREVREPREKTKKGQIKFSWKSEPCGGAGLHLHICWTLNPLSVRLWADRLENGWSQRLILNVKITHGAEASFALAINKILSGLIYLLDN